MKKNQDAERNNLALYLFHEGTNYKTYEYLGSHKLEQDGKEGVVFRTWAPNAAKISVVGEFNGWDEKKDPMERISEGGVWQCFIPDKVKEYDVYRYAVTTQDGEVLMKADPYAYHYETRPSNASKFYSLDGYEWNDNAWYQYKAKHPHYTNPVNIYEVHAGSWRKFADGNPFSYEKFADELIPYVKEMGYTHIELMPMTEYPYDGSWGYQVTGYFAPTARYGDPKEFMRFVDRCHQAGISVIMDWVPAHFPRDIHGLAKFDGTCCYEYADPRKGEHKDWGTLVFDYGRNEVISFLISSAVFWLEKYHIDGIRCDAVASMLYLDYSRKDGEWVPNKYGGKENLEAVAFLQRLNESAFAVQPDVMMIAEESTSWPMVSKPTYAGGLGFNYKWNMGWMNDMLKYMALDPIDRAFHHDMLTFSFFYAFSENFILPISHDEVVHGKASLVNKMYGGDIDNKFRQCKLFMAYMMAHPGKKLLFMGADFAQFREWDYENGLEWFMVDEYENHRNYLNYSKNLNHFYLDHPQFWERDFSWEGFSWISNDDFKQSIIIFRRFDKNGGEVIVVCNFVPVERKSYCFGVPYWGCYTEVFNSSSVDGSPCTNGTVKAVDEKMHGFDQSVCIDIPAFSCMYFTVKKEERPVPEKKAENKKKTKTAAKKTAVKKAAKAKTTKKSTAKKAE